MSEVVSRPARPWYTVLLCIFFLSGVTGLLYEAIWSSYLKLFLGHAAYAQTLVLIIFMGGMALGAAIAGRWQHKWGNLLLAYALTELVIGVAALLFHAVYQGSVSWAYDTLFPWLGAGSSITAAKWTLAALLILPQSILLGATFPLMSSGLLRFFPEKPGAILAVLYFANSFGAAIGVLVTGFWLIPAFGLTLTMQLAGVVNILLASWVILMLWSSLNQSAIATAVTPVIRPLNSTEKLLLLVAFGTGLSSFVYEIAWIRMLSLVLGSSTHAFEMMLSAFILGLAIGGYWIRKRIDSLVHPVRYLAKVQILMGVLAFATILAYHWTFDWMAFVLDALKRNDAGYTLFNISSHVIALVVMLPATICAGIALPLITLILLRENADTSAIGKVYASNTLGGIFGVVLASGLLLPYLGLKNTVVAGALIDVLLGLLLFSLIVPALMKKQLLLVSSVFAGTLLLLSQMLQWDSARLASGVYRDGQLGHKNIVMHKDGRTATVSVVKNDFQIAILTNGKTDASVSLDDDRNPDEPTQALLGALPLLYNPAAKRAAVIGIGSGITSHILLSSPQLEQVDTIEIEPVMLEGARWFGERSARTFTDPRSKLIIDDAKSYFSSQQQQYDLIISEPSNPWVSGVSSLFTVEFYHFIHQRLHDGGLLIQWIHLYENELELVYSILKGLDSRFGDYHIYASNNVDLVIVAAKEQLPERVAPELLAEATRAELALVGIEHQADLQLRLVANKKMMAPLLEESAAPVNSDFFPYVDQNAVKARFTQASAAELSNIRHSEFPLQELFSDRERFYDYDGNSLAKQCCDMAVDRAADAVALKEWHYNRTQLLQERPDAQRLTSMYLHFITVGHCSIEQETQWSENMVRLLDSLILYVPPLDLGSIWQSAQALSCFSGLSQPAKHLYYLTAALGQRDYQSVAEFSEMLRDSEAYSAGRTGRIVVYAGMIAYAAQQRYGELLALAEQYPQYDGFDVELLKKYARQQLLAGQ
ncbi:hypothetical protein QE250_16065 [Chromatiaceae bacterium AAb-1]|nr:hypothetical protein [Chromatiaceae bacterium AAb-1]